MIIFSDLCAATDPPELKQSIYGAVMGTGGAHGDVEADEDEIAIRRKLQKGKGMGIGQKRVGRNTAGSQKINTKRNKHLDPADGQNTMKLPTGSGRSLHISVYQVADINSEKAVLKAVG